MIRLFLSEIAGPQCPGPRRSGSTAFRGTPGPGGPANLLKLVDADNAVGKDDADIQLPSHGLDDLPQRADIHIGAALHFGNGCLIDVQQLRQVFLRQAAGSAGTLAYVLYMECISQPQAGVPVLPAMQYAGHTLSVMMVSPGMP